MAKKTKKDEGKNAIMFAGIPIRGMEDAVRYLDEFEGLTAKIAKDQARMVEIKRAVTEWAVKKKVPVVQLDDVYFRKIERTSTMWVATNADMPVNAPKGARSLKAICKGKFGEVGGKKVRLWELITKRVPDPEKIQVAVASGWVKEDEIAKAYLEKSQAPFLQRYEGEAVDA